MYCELGQISASLKHVAPAGNGNSGNPRALAANSKKSVTTILL